MQTLISPADQASRCAPTSLKLPQLLTITGRPGAGKDTQGERIAKYYGFEMLKTSGILTAFASSNPNHPDTLKINEAMQNGGLVPDDLVARVVTPELASHIHEGKNVMPNGFPRNAEQYVVYRNQLSEMGINKPWNLHIDISEEIAIQRILKGGRGRPDDTPDTVSQRMRIYHQMTAPMIERMRKDEMVISVEVTDPEETIDHLQERIRFMLESTFSHEFTIM